ncbi:cytochrome c oxidase subunit 3 [Rickettsiales endosymbiont of Stachyamoeba lipophora]|uniref:cytochrome c oxidase subunit 3 n=1 Tax=Rickettsiales endosymbiont of Stachyamoeba lipophora TaxID=2486578 RepID=UPI000F653551|nr:cytochrome c oxidase subunit 3 [Rickettsiales endosymbiont of Stachyamoeba lipophora]AZL15809.1 cytochrome c oxidase subunit 3 [Rickettsiales endosymbiont of Stachyamoeba lipophora]
MEKKHPYHLVELSPWPIYSAFSLLILCVGALLFMHKHFLGNILLPGGFTLVIFGMYVWWRDVVKEALTDKAHTEPVQNGLRIGMALFILSEVMFFFAFFFAFFKSALFPVDILDGVWSAAQGTWPPKGVETFDPWHLPLFNTLILLLSGTTVTWAHYALLENNRKDFIDALTITVILGFIFTVCQTFEYLHAPFGFKDGIYASNFYMATGFHGVHVLIGTIFLATCLIRARKGQMDSQNHLGFELAAWYWHFVDVVWLFLFVFVYLWGK